MAIVSRRARTVSVYLVELLEQLGPTLEFGRRLGRALELDGLRCEERFRGGARRRAELLLAGLRPDYRA